MSSPTDAKDQLIAAKDREILSAKDREIALLTELSASKERALQLEVEALRKDSAEQRRQAEQLRREIELLKGAHARELVAVRGSMGSVKDAVEAALREERARLAEQAAAAQYQQAQRRLWLRSPDCVLQVLCLVAMNGHDARGFANLSRAFRGDEVMWGCIKDRPGQDGKTALMACAKLGDLARVRWLLDRGANANARMRKDEWTPLVWACEFGHLSVVRELLDRGAVVNTAMGHGRTSLMEACMHGHLDIVRELLGRGANVNAQTNNGKTSLMLACHEEHLEVARLLLAHGASKASLSASGRTAYVYTPTANAELRALVKP